MKTPEEVKKGLECCDKQACEECPYDECGDDSRLCMPVLIEDSFELAQQIEVKAVKQSQRIAELEQELAAVKRERDAAVADLDRWQCEICAHRKRQWCDEPCASCIYRNGQVNSVNNFMWRGVCPENTEVQE